MGKMVEGRKNVIRNTRINRLKGKEIQDFRAQSDLSWRPGVTPKAAFSHSLIHFSDIKPWLNVGVNDSTHDFSLGRRGW